MGEAPTSVGESRRMLFSPRHGRINVVGRGSAKEVVSRWLIRAHTAVFSLRPRRRSGGGQVLLLYL